MIVMSISVEAGALRESLSDDKKVVDIRGHMNSLHVDSKHFTASLFLRKYFRCKIYII